MKNLQKITLLFMVSLIQSSDLQSSNFGSIASNIASSCLKTIGNNKIDSLLLAGTVGNLAYKKYLFFSILEPNYAPTARKDALYKYVLYGELCMGFTPVCLLGAMISGNFKIRGCKEAFQIGALIGNVGSFLHLRYQLQKVREYAKGCGVQPQYHFFRYFLQDWSPSISQESIDQYFQINYLTDKNDVLLNAFLSSSTFGLNSGKQKIIFENIDADYIQSLDSAKKIKICKHSLKNGHLPIAASMIDQNPEIFQSDNVLETFCNDPDYSAEQVQGIKDFLQTYIPVVKISEE